MVIYCNILTILTVCQDRATSHSISLIPKAKLLEKQRQNKKNHIHKKIKLMYFKSNSSLKPDQNTKSHQIIS